MKTQEKVEETVTTKKPQANIKTISNENSEVKTSKLTLVDFERIYVSSFTDVNLSDLAINPPTIANIGLNSDQTKSVVGRKGEKFVYEYLCRKYPNGKVEWVNKDSESGQPFDIQLFRDGESKRADLIEVKSTRFSKQNTFQISINEIKCLLENEDNYYIYRVYYSDKLSTSKITILNEIKAHFNRKQLALSITIPSLDDQQQTI